MLQDLDGSGSIDTHELALVLRKLGEVASEAR
jgi:Ca2+-binding EF-hand superfamily protein